MRAGSKIVIGVVGLLLALSNFQAAELNEWPQWRGVNRDGMSKEAGLLKTWSAGGPELKWKATELGGGFAGISVVGGKIFTMGDVDGASQLMALEDGTGKKLWSTKIGEAGGGDGYPGPRGTPTVAAGNVYALNQFGELLCADATSGKELWRKNLVKDFGGQRPRWGYAESPLFDSGKLFCTPGGQQGTMIALDAKTGDLLWRTQGLTDAPHHSSMILETVFGQKQVIQLTSASVVGVSVADGKVLWRASRPGKTAVVPTPVFADNQVFVTSGYGIGCNAFKISKDEKGFNAEQVYANTNMVNHHGGVILLNGYVYGFSDSNGWVCLDFKTGEIAWADKGVGKGAIAYADGHFYIRSESGKGAVALIEANPAKYVEKGRFDQVDRSDKNSWPHPVIVNGMLYLRDQGTLLCYDVKGK
ncbi:MAG: PQQ-binding-like beta-propeller repeat protein [Victivallales bacterium]|jgi:outer membrane protein assembly factor BamB